ncbi:MAG: hypothetical protein ABSE07_09960 [Methanoregula sp.]|jgi:hypothetical protein
MGAILRLAQYQQDYDSREVAETIPLSHTFYSIRELSPYHWV